MNDVRTSCEGETNFDILTEHIDSHSMDLANLCQRFFDGMPAITDDESEKNVTLFREYLHKFSFFDQVFYQFIVNCCMFSGKYPKDSFFSFRDALPDVDLDSSKPPQPRDSWRALFTDHVGNIDYSQSHMRAALKFFICRCTSFFMRELLRRLSGEKMRENGMIDIAKSITGHIFSYRYDQFGVAYMTEALKAWSKSFRLISRVVPSGMIQEALSTLKRQGITSTQKTFALLLFRSIVVPDVATVMPLVQVVEDIYQSTPSKNVQNLAGTFLLNLIGQMLEIDSNVELDGVYELAKRNIGASARDPDIAFQLVAMITNFQEKIGVNEYISMTEAAWKNACRSVLAGITIKVRRNEIDEGFLVEWLNSNVSKANAESGEAEDLFFAIWKNHPGKLLEMIPKLKPDFIVALLKSGKSILKKATAKGKYYQKLAQWMEGNIVEMSERHANDSMGTEVFFETASFTLGLRTAVEERENTLSCLVKNLPRSSRAFYMPDLGDGPSRASEVTDEWLGFADSSFKNMFRVHYKASSPSQTFSDPAHFACLCSVPYVTTSESIIMFLIRSLFSKDTKCGSLAIRTIQAMIHMHPDIANSVLDQLQKCVEQGNMNGPAMAVAGNAITFAVEAALYQRIELSNERVLSLKCATVLGFCTGYPSLRKRLDECFKFRRDFIDREEAKRKVVLSVTHISPEEVKLLPNVTFEQLIVCNMPLFFLFICSSTVGKVLPTKLVSMSFRLIVRFLENNKDQRQITMVGNSLALALSLEAGNLASGDLNAKAMSILADSTRCLADMCGTSDFGEFSDVFLCGIVSGLAELHQPFILPIFAKNNTIHQRALWYCLKESINRTALHPLDSNGNLKPFLGEIMSSTVSYFFDNGIVESDLSPHGRSSELMRYSKLHLLIHDFATVLKFIFEKIYTFWKDPHAVLVTQTYVSPEVDYPFSGEKWFILLCNLSFHTDCIFSIPVITALARWLTLFAIPDKCFTVFIPKMMQISEIVPEITYPVFGRYTEHLITYFLNERKFHVFKGIIAQLSCQSITSVDMLPDSRTLTDNPTLRILYRYCGSLVVLTLYHTMSRFSDRRTAAMEFLNSLVVLVMLIRGEQKAAVMLHSHISMIRRKMKSYTFFLRTTIGELNSLLSNVFAFCSEQALGQIAHILNSLSQGKQESLPKGKKMQPKASVSLSSSLMNTKIHVSSFPNLASNQFFGSLMSQRIPVSAIWWKTHVQFDKINKIGSFMTDWMKPFTYDLRIVGVAARCEPQFRQFCLYSFTKAILFLSSDVDMSETFHAVLDVVLEASHEMMLLCLLDLRMNHDLEETARRFMIYIHHASPEMFSNFVDNSLRVSSWWFSEVQLMKQLPEMKGILDSETHASDRSTDDDRAFESSVFSSTVPFLLSVFLMLIRHKRDSLRSIHSHIITFCYLFLNSPIGDIADELLCQITGLKQPGLAQSGTGFQGHTPTGMQPEKWKISEILPFLKATDDENRYLLEWGLCCGDITVATRALNLYHRLGCILPGNAVDTALRSSQIVASVLYERFDPENTNAFKTDVFLKMVNYQPNGPCLDSYIQYFSSMLLVLLDYVIYSRNFDPRIYHLALSFLQASNDEYNELLTVVLTIINEYAAHIELDIHKLIPLILSLQISSMSALKLVFTVIYTLDNLTKTADIICLLALIPYVWSAYRSILYSRFPKEEVDSPNFIENYANSVVPRLAQKSLRLIMTFFSRAVRFGDPAQRMAIYLEAQAILPRLKSPGVECSLLLYHLITDRENDGRASHLFKIAITRGIKVLVPAQVNSAKPLTFPQIKCVAFNPDEWKAVDGDVFASVETFPPVYLTDPAFAGSTVLASVKRACETVKVTPFTKWSEDLFQAQLQNSAETEHNDRMEIEVHPESAGEIQRILAIALREQNEQVLPDDLPSPSHQQEEMELVNPFVLSNEEVVKLGEPILRDLDFVELVCT